MTFPNAHHLLGVKTRLRRRLAERLRYLAEPEHGAQADVGGVEQLVQEHGPQSEKIRRRIRDEEERDLGRGAVARRVLAESRARHELMHVLGVTRYYCFLAAVVEDEAEARPRAAICEADAVYFNSTTDINRSKTRHPITVRRAASRHVATARPRPRVLVLRRALGRLRR